MIFLTGAPASSALDWGEECLDAPLLEAFQNRHDRQDRQSHGEANMATLPNQPAWRFLPLATKHLPSGLTQESVYMDQNLADSTLADNETSFLTATDLSLLPNDSILEGTQVSLRSESSSDDVLSQFYEHSFTVHEHMPALNVMTPFSLADEALKSPSERVLNDQEPPGSSLTRAKPRSSRLSTLREIPNAAYLRSLEPQTMTVDLVVGILHISQPRSIKTRRDSRWVELVEMTVADDTKAGFAISIWLSQVKPSNPRKAQEQELHSIVTRIRPRDIVLVKNLALASFQKKVHGQSLRKANTTLDLLYRTVVDSHDEPGAYSLRELDGNDASDVQLGRVKKVKEWVMSFVGSGSDLLLQPRNISKDLQLKTRRQQQLPSDTP